MAKSAIKEQNSNTPSRAILLAAGMGTRMVPINSVPKALIEINNIPIIERLIEQLHMVGIKNITIIIGYMKEKFDYLISKYEVELVFNPEYSHTNTLYSLSLCADKLVDCYILPADIWYKDSPFHYKEEGSWYRTKNVSLIKQSSCFNLSHYSGIAYIDSHDSTWVSARIKELATEPLYHNACWEEALFLEEHFELPLLKSSDDSYVGIDTYEELRDFHSENKLLQSSSIEIICEALNISPAEIQEISALKKGMTNRSFLFSINSSLNQKKNRYIMRIPGRGSERLINRAQEARVYKTIQQVGICDEILYINPDNGYKISRYIEGAKPCNAADFSQVKLCMNTLRSFHNHHLCVDHFFDLFHNIQAYEKLWKGKRSKYPDYAKVKENIFSLQSFINSCPKHFVLTHIDANPDNFLISNTSEGEQVRLIDWEYASMQDPHLDIAMFGIYALYNRQQMDALIDAYFPEGCNHWVRVKIYAYIAIAGLLWSNWCEFKENEGAEFGAYSLRQYQYAKEYYDVVAQELKMSK